MPISKRIAEASKGSSWIRKMFEEGRRLTELHGCDSVFDFSIGNPCVEPPAEFQQVLEELARDRTPGVHGYMPNAGYLETRRAVADCLSADQGIEVPADNVVMTSGAGGALNVIFKTILDTGQEVIVPAPYFMEYVSYVDNHGGVLKPVSSRADFDIDVDAIEKAMNAQTRAVLINSPNNPTGRVYPQETLEALGAMLRKKSREEGRIIFLVSDEPYRRIVYDGVRVPPVLASYENSIIANSYSKELSLAGERIGYVAAGPRVQDASVLMAGLIYANRILGFVNAPALMQRVVARLQGVTVDLNLYQRNRDVLYGGLSGAGFEVQKPEGAFYLFPKAPIDEDVAFAQELLEHLVLVVPGSGFGMPGYFRMAYCVDSKTADAAVPIFETLGKKYFS
jgi:aspartate aminotransferase